MWPRAPRGRTRTGCWSLALDVQQAIGAANMRFCLVALLCLWSVFSTFLALLCVRAFFFCTREPIRPSSSFSKVVAVDSRPEELCCSMCADPLPSKPVPRACVCVSLPSRCPVSAKMFAIHRSRISSSRSLWRAFCLAASSALTWSLSALRIRKVQDVNCSNQCESGRTSPQGSP